MSECQLDFHVAALRALADPLRWRLLRLLHDRGETCVCELLDELGTTQSNISMHLRVLRDAGLITSQKVGKWAFYTLDQERVESLLTGLGAAFAPATAGAQRSADAVYACCSAGEVPASRAQAAAQRNCGHVPAEECVP